MSLSIELKEYLQNNGATEVGFADITNFSPKEGLNSGVVFYITYPKEIIRDMENAPTLEYVLELVDLNTRLDALGMLCEEYLIVIRDMMHMHKQKRDWELILVNSIHLNCLIKQ